MAPLKGFQRTYLRGLAHPMRPVVRVGKDGATDPVLAAIEDALAARELIKVALPGDRNERRDLAATIAARSGGECVGMVGGVAVYFRRHADPAKRRIMVPTRPGADHAG